MKIVMMIISSAFQIGRVASPSNDPRRGGGGGGGGGGMLGRNREEQVKS